MRNLISVPIFYRLDKDEIIEGHLTRCTPTDTPRSFAWDIGTNGKITQTVPTSKKHYSDPKEKNKKRSIGPTGLGRE